MSSRPTLSALVEALVDAADTPFALEDFVLRVAAQRSTSVTAKLRSSVEKILEFEAPVFRADDGRYVPRWSWFAGAAFLVSPTERELELGVLVPGHRFVPFLSPSRNPTDARLAFPGRDVAASKTVELPFSEAVIYHSLLDQLRFAELLPQPGEDASGEAGLPGLDHPVSLKVFDLAWFYAEHDMRCGDVLEATVLDYRSGSYAVACRKRETLPSDARGTPWGEALEDGFARSLEARGPYETVEETAAWAWFLGGPSTRHHPACSLGKFIEDSSCVALTRRGMETGVWWKGEDLWEAMIQDSERKRLRARPDSLEGTITRLGIARTASEVDAIIRDELFHDRRSIARIMDRILLGRSHGQFPPGLLAALELQVERRQQHIAGSYSKRRDAVNGPLRSRALGLLDTVSKFIIRQSPPPGKENQEASHALLAFMQGMAPISQIVDLLNRASFDARERAVTDETLGTIESNLPGMLELMDAKLHSTAGAGTTGVASRPSRRKRESPVGPAAVVQLRIELRRISPRIWRRVLVPADCTLGRLHDVIQSAMGWDGSHLHEFVVDGITYGDSDSDLSDEPSDDLDEESVTLAGLGLRTGRRLYYTYDFGDSWDHVITVQRLISPAPDGWTGVPRCVAGARACPPEDCGGTLGYQHALEILARPDSALDEDDRTIKKWLGTFDPERFDLDQANQMLASV